MLQSLSLRARYGLLIIIALAFWWLQAQFSESGLGLASTSVYNHLQYNAARYEAVLETHQRAQIEIQQHIAPTPPASFWASQGKRLQHFMHNELFPFWYGTPYDFNGTTLIPRTGHIACGYFVTTLLEDAGVSLDRVKLAQMPSEQMILSLVDEAYIQRFRNVPLPQFVEEVAQHEGLYIIGLDTHSGFLLSEGGKVFIIHASGRSPYCVLKEPALGSKTLKKSKYKIIGCISDDPTFLRRWLGL